MKEKKFKVSGRVRGLVTGASVVLLFCMAGALSAMAGTIHAQAKGDSSTAAIGGNVSSTADLSCTYYDHGQTHPGTCVTRPGDPSEYFCAENGTARLQKQSSCKWKIERTKRMDAAQHAVGKEKRAKKQAASLGDNAVASDKIIKGVTAPVLIYGPEPQYTRKAQQAKYQGVVKLQIIVTKKGRPVDIKVVQHLGMGLDEQAVKAVKRYRFKPARYHGNPVAVRMIVEVDFHLFRREKKR